MKNPLMIITLVLALSAAVRAADPNTMNYQGPVDLQGFDVQFDPRPHDPLLSTEDGIINSSDHPDELTGMNTIPNISTDSSGEAEWVQIITNDPPSPRFWHTANFIPNKNWMVVGFGRDNSINWFDDSWYLDLNDNQWHTISPSSVRPAKRDRYISVYDNNSDQILIYGGYKGSGDGYHDDVWKLSLITLEWSQLSVTAPTPHVRCGHYAFFDPDRNSIIIYGGYYYEGGWHNLKDMWMFDLETNTWEEIFYQGDPPELNGGFETAYDKLNDRWYFYGGGFVDSNPNILWVFDKSALKWEKWMLNGEIPSPRAGLSLIYDYQNCRLLIYGGFTREEEQIVFYNDLWEINPITKETNRIEITGTAQYLRYSTSLFDEVNQRMLFFGGNINSAMDVSNKTYALELRNLMSNCQQTQPVSIDIKPGSCPNPLNAISRNRGKAVMPVAILGTDEFDVHEINPESVTLNGVGPLRWSYEDVGTPVDKTEDSCACTEDGPDGYEDLTLKFDRQAIISSLNSISTNQLGTTAASAKGTSSANDVSGNSNHSGPPLRASYVLRVEGQLKDGTDFEGYDCVVLMTKGEAVTVALNETPRDLELIGNYPNPFNPVTEIRFYLPEAAHVKLEIFNVLGRRVATLADWVVEAGDHTVGWNGSNSASGVYLYRLTAGDYSESKKMLLLK